MSRALTWSLSSAGTVVLLGLIWWGWQQGGLALLQLGLGSCL
ncbi:hypothetical protein ACVW0Y_004246 [Pseudomonas sp. TE3786]